MEVEGTNMECVANIFMNQMKKVEPENKFTKNSDASNMEPCKNNHNFRFDYLIILKFYPIILQIQFYKGPHLQSSTTHIIAN
jgi:hypothetical protein